MVRGGIVSAVVRAASKEGRKEAVVGQGREAAAATEATVLAAATWCLLYNAAKTRKDSNR